MLSSSWIARSKSLLSIADLTRLMSRLVVSPPDPSQTPQIRSAMALALSSSGASLSAPNRKSRFCRRSLRGGRDELDGGSIQPSACAKAGTGADSTAAMAAARKGLGNRDRMWQM
jgi:hypothetical protein